MKQAYPNYSEFIPPSPSYDLGKWMNAMKDIYIKVHLGASRDDSIDQVTHDWDKMEKVSFLDWMKYYESGDQNKYKKAKFAQHSYYVNDALNYFVPNPPKIPSPIMDMNQQIAQIPQQAEQALTQKPADVSQEDKRKIIEEQRKKILGRLNSAEKLLSSHQGQIFAGPDFERLLSAIYELKKQIQTVNKITLSAQTCVDLIVRQANILRRQGFAHASEFMVKLAQNTPGDFSMNLGDTPAGGSQPQGGGSLGNNTPSVDSMMGGAPPGLGDTPPDETDPLSGGMAGFLANTSGAGITLSLDDDDDKSKKDENAADEVDLDDEDDVLLDQEIIPEDEDDLVVEAQAAPAPTAAPAVPADPGLEVESPAPTAPADEPLPDAAKEPVSPEKAQADEVRSDIDSLIESAFANLTINDVIKKLEDVNKIFRIREISRQLAIVDVMLGRLGLAPYFPTLAEATTKQLEANQYCLTRIEDILSKLRGTQQTGEIDLTHEERTTSPGVEQTKQNLEQSEQKEREKKEMKRQLEDQQMMAKLKPQPEVEGAPQELAAQPTELETPAPAPAPAPTPRPIR
jgi:hypothetical protein